MRILRIAALAVVLAVPGPTAPAAQQKAAEQKPVPAPTGRDLYQMLGGDRLTLQSLQAILSIAGRDSKVAPYEGIIRSWLDSSMASSHIGDDMAKYYSETFTPKELQEIAAFLKTPTGQKVVAQLPGVIQHSANLSAVMMEQNRANLEEAMGKKKSGSKPRR